MEWYWVVLIIFGGLMILMLTGFPVAFCFLLIDVIGAFMLWGGSDGLRQLLYVSWFSVASFTYVPVVMFVLLGEVINRSGIAIRAIDVLDKWLGRLPGRLALLAVGLSTLFSTMSGSSIATTAMLGEVLVPEMTKRGYKKTISLGAIMGTGGLAIMIPPSSPAVIWASLAGVSVGKLLLSGVVPGLIMAAIFAIYVVGRCFLQPSIAPSYEVKPPPMRTRIDGTLKYVVPLAFVVFMVTGVILVGIAGPSEAAAMGVLGSVILALIYRSLSWKSIIQSLNSTFKISVMILFILCTSSAYSQILSFTGAAREFVAWVFTLQLPSILVVSGMMFILLVLGCFMSGIPMMMITIPLFMPVVTALHINPVWFGLLNLMMIEIGQQTPPFAVLLFTMQSVAPPGTTTKEIIMSDLPYLLMTAGVLILIMLVPVIATWLPDLMRQASA